MLQTTTILALALLLPLSTVAQLREMSTDRPDATESPYTVDKGHFQLEMSFFDYSGDKDDVIKTTVLGIAPINFKYGLLDNIDLQLVFTPYERLEVERKSGGTTSSADGFSDDTQIRVKINLWGLNGESTAFALMPYIKFPIGSAGLSNDKVEGGLILPLALSLPNDWGIGLMAEFDNVYDFGSDEYNLDFVQTGTVGHDLPWGGLGGYLEYIGVAPGASGAAYQATFSGGLTRKVGENVQFDGGLTLGLIDSANDYSFFLGYSIRR